MSSNHIIITILLCLGVGVLSSVATYSYVMKTEVGKAMRFELTKHYGTRRMREFIGMPHPELPQIIYNISQRFAQIFEQSELAEQDGYSEICGVGYGKALEVLIKDYAIFLKPEIGEIIKRSSLAICISTHIEDSSIRESADLARWLRNDETHYEKSFSEYGSDQLRGLIKMTIILIEQAEAKRKTIAELATIREGMVNDKNTTRARA